MMVRVSGYRYPRLRLRVTILYHREEVSESAEQDIEPAVLLQHPLRPVNRVYDPQTGVRSSLVELTVDGASAVGEIIDVANNDCIVPIANDARGAEPWLYVLHSRDEKWSVR